MAVNIKYSDVNVGDVFYINSGGTITVLALSRSNNITIQHNDEHKFTTTTTMSHIREGRIRNPKHYKQLDGTYQNRYDLKIGDLRKSVYGENYILVKPVGETKFTIEFIDEHRYSYDVNKEKILTNRVVNPYGPSVYNRGFRGVGPHQSCLPSGKQNPLYTKWTAMLKRCYSETCRHEYPSYTHVEVCEEWLNFQEFANWCVNDGKYMTGHELDKDLLSGESKIYSPETCCFIPSEINSTIIVPFKPTSKLEPRGISLTPYGKYKVSTVKNGITTHRGNFDDLDTAIEVYVKNTKEKIHELANKYKSQITEEVYNRLMNYPNK